MTSRHQTAAHGIAVAGLAGVFAYQGVVPKLWKRDPGEVAIWQGLGLAERRATRMVLVTGAAEATFAVVTVAERNHRGPSWSRSPPCRPWRSSPPGQTGRS
jgi:hypothetical protein